MKVIICTTLTEASLHRRLQQIFGTDDYISKVGTNIVAFTSIGSGNNLAVRKIIAGEYELWMRSEVYKYLAHTDPEIITNIIEELL